MKPAPQPTNEPERIAALQRYSLIDTTSNKALDSVARAAANLCDAPIALINFVDTAQLRPLSGVGVKLNETRRDGSFCAHAILEPGAITEVEDATRDERFAENSWVTGDHKVHFYAGRPLVTPEGCALGTLCLLDSRSRTLTMPQRQALDSLADTAMAILEERSHSTSAQQADAGKISGFGDVIEASINEVYLFDEQTLRFIHVNRGARRNLGYSMEQLRDLTPIDIKPEFTPSDFESVLEPLRSGERRKVDFTTIHQRSDGSCYPVEVHLQRSQFEATPVFAAIILDVTERTQTEEALAQSRLFLESAPDATVIVNESGKIEVANSQTAALFEYSPDELRGLPIEKLIPERYRTDHVAHRETFTTDPRVRGMGADLNLFAVTKQGREIPIEVSLSPIQTGDGMLVAAAVRDISDRVAAAQQLEAARDQAESATATKSRFLAAASHDLRQPLQSVGLYLSVLKRILEDPKALEISEKMRQSLDVMGELLDALLDISKLDAGSIEPTKKDFALQSMLDQLVADNAPHAQAKGLELLCPPSTKIVNSDPALLQRIVENFVTNALRYTESGVVEIRCQPHAEFIRIEVKDSGVGIPEESLDSIFEEYYQLDNPVRDRRKGLGLGLSIVKHIARLLDHKIAVTSSPGLGSTFSVEVPLGRVTDRSAEAEPRSQTSGRATRYPIVLLVDDDPAVIDATTMLLDVSGFEVHTALDGEQALAHITKGLRPDVVVSDYRLPGLTGVEVIRRIREATTANLPTLLITGDTATKEIAAANLADCTVLHKPVDTDRLIKLIDRITQ